MLGILATFLFFTQNDKQIKIIKPWLQEKDFIYLFTQESNSAIFINHL